MELDEIIAVAKTVPTWAQVVAAGWGAYVFLAGNGSLLKRTAQALLWAGDKARLWWRRPSRIVALERKIEAEREIDRHAQGVLADRLDKFMNAFGNAPRGQQKAG